MSQRDHRASIRLAIRTLTVASLVVTCGLAWARPLVGGCGPGSAGRSGASEAIPGDPQGRKGWLDKAQADDAGNQLESWCIEIVGGVGNSFGYRFTPAGAGPLWIGRCAFVGGQNVRSKEPTADANRNGKPDKWKTITWTSEDDGGGGATDPKDDDKTAGKKDYDWEYNIATNRLKRWETNNGVRLRPNQPDSDAAPPQNFDNLFAAAPPPNAGQVDEMNAAAVVDVALLALAGDIWNYVLTGNDTEFSPTMIEIGDSWSLAAAGIVAAQAPVDWAIAFVSDYATWTYRGSSPLNLSLHPLDGFVLQSAAALGTVNWLSDSATDELANFGYAGQVAGPRGVAEPSTLALLGIAAYALWARNRKLHRCLRPGLAAAGPNEQHVDRHACDRLT